MLYIGLFVALCCTSVVHGEKTPRKEESNGQGAGNYSSNYYCACINNMPQPFCVMGSTLFHFEKDLVNCAKRSSDMAVSHLSYVAHIEQAVSLNEDHELSAGEGPRDHATTPYLSNATCKKSKSEFECTFHWDDEKLLNLKKDILDRMKNRQKSFIRFTVPVVGYTNKDLPMFEDGYDGILTWVWVLTKHQYMLHYPHNFVILSMLSMGIITKDWALDYTENTVSLSKFSFNIKDSFYKHEANMGQCDPDCLAEHKSCGIGKYELLQLLNNVTNRSEEYMWELICLQLPYEDIVNVTRSSNFIIPDFLYYVLFLKNFFYERPLFGIAMERHTFIQYRCYEGIDLSVSKDKELFQKYFIIPFIALFLWLYSPLLIHYFPSSSVKTNHEMKTPPGMFPSHKSPKYFGKYLKCIFCFYPPQNSNRNLVCLRRILFLAIIILSSVRLFFVFPYWKLTWGIAFILLIATLYPFYISEHVNPEKKFTFMGWEIPPHLISINPDLKEYQLLAAIMQERIYITIDYRFLDILINRYCFNVLADFPSTGSNVLYTVIRSVLKFLLFWSLIAIVVFNLIYYFFPLFYFIKEMWTSVFKLTFSIYQPSISVSNKVFAVIHGFLMFCTLMCIMVVIFFWCYALTEFSLFTLMGGALLPSMAFPYFILLAAIIGAVYSMVHLLHDDYEKIIANIISILNSECKIPTNRLFDPSNARVRRLVKTKAAAVPSSYTISVFVGRRRKQEIMKHSVVATFISRKLFDFVVEKCHPMHKQVPFIILQVIAILFYASTVAWVKNVYHLEAEVDAIFSLVSIVPVTFVPNILRFFAYKSYFGKKTDNVLNQNIYFAIIDFFAKLDDEELASSST